MSRILLVEDDSSLGSTLQSRLEKEGHDVYWVTKEEEARQEVETRVFELVILDVGLPDGDGFALAKQIRQTSTVPFLFVTAQSGAEQRLKGYELGAEEYIPKPFHLKELLIRVQHVLDNHAPAREKAVGSLKILFDERAILKPGEQKTFLKSKEFQTLSCLISKAPKVVSRDEILDEVWGEDHFPSHRTVDNIILKLRTTLGEDVGQCIRSVRGVGYQWVEWEELHRVQ